MRAELVKLGWIEYSALPVIPAGAHLTFTVDGMSGVATVDVPLGSGVYMAAPSCSLDSAHQTVDLGNFNKRSSGSFPQEGAQTRFGIGFTCSSYTNNVEFTFDDANAILKGNDKLVAHSEADGGKLTGVAVALYDAQGNPIIMGTKQILAVHSKEQIRLIIRPPLCKPLLRSRILLRLVLQEKLPPKPM